MKFTKIFLFILLAFFITGINSVNADDVTGSVTVTVLPEVTLSASKTTGISPLSSVLTWTVSGDATSCTATDGWSGSKSATGGSETINNITSTTVFSIFCTNSGGNSSTVSVTVTPTIQYTLTITKAGTGDGSTTGSGVYNSGQIITMTYTPDSTSVFAGWSGDSDCSDGSVTMDSNKTCTATFTTNACPAPLSKEVTVACDLNSYGYPATSGLVTRNQTKTAYPSCVFETEVTTSNSTYVRDNCVYAKYTVTPSAGANGTISPNTALSNIDKGATVSFTINPSDNYITSVGGTCGGTLSGNIYTTNAITSNCTVVATFTKSECSAPLSKEVTVPCDLNSYGYPATSGSVTRSQTKTAYPGCIFETEVTTSNSTYVRDNCVYASPTATLSVNPSSVSYNGRPTLTWSSSNADSCTAGGPWSNDGTLSGSGITDYLTSDTTFTFQCSGNGQTSALQSVTVTVGSAPTGYLTPAASSCLISVGDNSCDVDISWSTNDPIATSAVTAVGMTNVNDNSGNQSFSVPYSSRTFYLYNDGILLDQDTITSSCVDGTNWNGSMCVNNNVNPNAPVIEAVDSKFYTNYNLKFKLTATDPDTSDTLIYGIDWNNDGIVEASDWTSPYVSSGTSMFLEHIWNGAGNYNFQAIAKDNNGGLSSWTPFTITVVNKPSEALISSFVADKTKIEYGGSVVLTWQSSYSDSCSITSTPSPSIDQNNLAASDSIILTPSKTTLYTLSCNGEGGSSAPKQIRVTVGQIKPIYNER